MPGFKTIQVSLESEIAQAAIEAVIRCERSGREYDREIVWYGKGAWVFTSTRRGEDMEYGLVSSIPSAFYDRNFTPTYVCLISPKGRSIRPVNISGLSIEDRQHLLDSLARLP